MTEKAVESISTLEDKENSQEGKYLTFSLKKDIYGIDIQYILEVIIWSKKL